MGEYQYDIGIIGSGPAGLAAAFEAKRLGKKVVIVEMYRWGGTCPNYGCDPKKILLSAVEGIRRAQAMDSRGLEGRLQINWPELMAYKQAYVDAVEPRKLAGLDQAGIDRYYGQAQFIDGNHVTVNSDVIQAADWIIAVGQRPRQLSFPGIELTQDSEAFLNLSDMPADVTFIGGGYIGIEFANISQVAGAKVHLISRGQNILREFDPELTAQMQTQMRKAGVEYHLQNEVVKVISKSGRLQVTLTDGETFMTDKVFVTAGRVGNADRLNLEKINVDFEASGIIVDEHLQTTQPHIFAIGDVANSPVPKIVPVGNFEGRYVVRQIVHQTKTPIVYPTLPVVVFGTPRIAQTGVSIVTAEGNGYRVLDIDMGQVITFYRYHDQARIRVAINQSGHIVGASVFAAEAEELINYFVTAINEKRTLEDTQANIYAYPSLGSEFSSFY
ncbi:NAD(P)/FAD-dependent oxidoreductase [Weissella diestrammenae]|uniref:NAD(P)/FAD-dependent oxidoreductase n=1 Tax=Weissella diestrammenae TaxID=1162633 RepID=A0A7G9T5D4_9LACO|nr:NAD(P)/FAD-dependent oxidoreductase [Weissella diestrammenae]MCM0583169.1 NAD(P)/FAD-dependent oxidoreductase [Weissella diestrammenae]QNN75309.1 NAD(P)/FAD-dependent oxidoreductase [Weissella diestrammenae]